MTTWTKALPHYWHVAAGPVPIAVHCYSDIPGEWFVTCDEAGLDGWALECGDLARAKKIALRLVRERLTAKWNALNAAFDAMAFLEIE